MNENSKWVFIPTILTFCFGDKLVYVAGQENGLFTCHRELEEDLTCSEIIVQSEKVIVDTIVRDIKLSKGDILHFEYQLDVKFW